MLLPEGRMCPSLTLEPSTIVLEAVLYYSAGSMQIGESHNFDLPLHYGTSVSLNLTKFVNANSWNQKYSLRKQSNPPHFPIYNNQVFSESLSIDLET
jgi:hypothetical protein